ncbi:hypothetical protein T484DRAFT_2824776 [Baffinella frigidus]|nr:hypothetical protein T484DRAFT_2824776 [Cryptophyta sp. CCMP2293]
MPFCLDCRSMRRRGLAVAYLLLTLGCVLASPPIIRSSSAPATEAADPIPGTAIPPWVSRRGRRRAKHVPEHDHGHSHHGEEGGVQPLASKDGSVRLRSHKSAPLAHPPHISALDRAALVVLA